ncbi:hypothetical protein [Chryseobacterium salivictor]|uniref:Uncharacterized protein n=1 Tax=Chryseobacterium salivictor TaxID=2547600 RepID=A0A4P6ZJF8_9FLAO|nr:hypothetical protein [Chryseobacterium salivictor]QBO59707.1 hypothetical protein NBC122_02907 [Chryseobacterium salivictor]
MKKFALIAAVVFTTITLQSCRQSDDVLSPEEAATLQRVQDSTTVLLQQDNEGALNTQTANDIASELDGELVPPPKK